MSAECFIDIDSENLRTESDVTLFVEKITEFARKTFKSGMVSMRFERQPNEAHRITFFAGNGTCSGAIDNRVISIMADRLVSRFRETE